MSVLAQEMSPADRLKGTIGVFLSIGVVAAGITLLFLGMRSVMDIGGACASGGPYVPARPCPDGVPMLMMLGIWGGIAGLAVYVWQTMKRSIPSLIAFAWPALFLSLGYNFLDYGISPPDGSGLVWGWLICAIVFGLMGGLPLLIAFKPVMRGFSKSPPDQPMKPMEPLASMARSMPKPRRRRPSAEDIVNAVRDSTMSGDEGMVGALERLAALHRSGALTDEEFAAAKRHLIGDG